MWKYKIYTEENREECILAYFRRTAEYERFGHVISSILSSPDLSETEKLNKINLALQIFKERQEKFYDYLRTLKANPIPR